MRRLATSLLLCLVLAPALAAAGEPVRVRVTTPYLELRTGPGRGYPVFDVVKGGREVEVLFMRTQWLKVRTRRGVEGWASEHDMQLTVLADGQRLRLGEGTRREFIHHHFEAGAFAGVYGGASLVSEYLAYCFNSRLSFETALGQYYGRYSNGITADFGLTHVIEPHWRLSPLLMIGTGLVHIEPKATLVRPATRTEQTAYVGGGVRFYLGRSFFVRAEYKTHVVFTRLNNNQVEDEWKLGFAVFF